MFANSVTSEGRHGAAMGYPARTGSLPFAENAVEGEGPVGAVPSVSSEFIKYLAGNGKRKTASADGGSVSPGFRSLCCPSHPASVAVSEFLQCEQYSPALLGTQS